MSSTRLQIGGIVPAHATNCRASTTTSACRIWECHAASQILKLRNRFGCLDRTCTSHLWRGPLPRVRRFQIPAKLSPSAAYVVMALGGPQLVHHHSYRRALRTPRKLQSVTRAAGSGGARASGFRTGSYRYWRRACMPSETQVSFGVHPCRVLQYGHRENVTLSGSLSMSARSISMCVWTSLFVLGHSNINFVNGTSQQRARPRGSASDDPPRQSGGKSGG